MYTEIYHLYLECFPDYPIQEPLFLELLKPEKAHILTEHQDDRLVGFSLIHDKSIAVLCVAPAYRGRGIGSRLLQASEAYIDGVSIVLGRGSHYLLQGVPADTPEAVQFFEKRGYTASWTSINMKLSLSDFDISAIDIPKAPDDVSFRFAALADRPSLLAAVEAAQSSWKSIYERCTAPIFVAVQNGRIVGFEILEPSGGYFAQPYQTLASIGCVGVVPDARNQGIGLQMVAHGIDWLKNQGCISIELRYTWLEDWYEKLGFKTAHRQWMGEKRRTDHA